LIKNVTGQWEIQQYYPKIFTFHFQGSRLITLNLTYKSKDGNVIAQQSFIIDGWGPDYDLTDVIEQHCPQSITNSDCPESVFIILKRQHEITAQP
jgi:hypothetical protein